MEELGLKGNHVQCIFHLFKADKGLSSSKLCFLCDEDKAAISRTLKELEKLNYVCEVVDGNKKYRNPIKLTAKGKKVGKIIMNKIEENFNLCSEGIEEKNRENLYASLEKISNNLKNLCEELGDKNYD